MRKLLLLLLTCTCSLGWTHAQSLLKEGFEGDTFPPEGWTTRDDQQAGSVHHWEAVSFSAPVDKKAAYCDAGFSADEPAKEEWLITPALTLDNRDYKLQFYWTGATAASISAKTPEYDVQVRATTDGGTTWETIWSFLNQEQVEASGVKFPWNAWKPNQSLIDLSAYKGKTVQFAFLHCKLMSGRNGNCVWLDEVLVEPYTAVLTPQMECATTAYRFTDCYIGVKKYSDAVTIKNVGQGTLTLDAIEGLEGTDFATTLDPSQVSLKKNEEYTFHITYTPTLYGAANATLTLKANGGDPVSISLTGSKTLLPSGYTLESFEGDAFPPVGWTLEEKGSFSGWMLYKNGGFSGDKSALSGPTQESNLITPRLDLSGEQDHTLTFDYMETSQTEEQRPQNYFDVYLSTDGGETWSSKPVFSNDTCTSVSFDRIIRIKANLGHPGDNCRVKFSYTLDMDLSGGYDNLPEYSYIYLDDVVLPPLYGASGKPAATTVVSPANEATGLYNKEVKFEWNGALFATGYRFYLGTSPNQFDLINGEDLGASTSYQPNIRLQYATTYYWKVVAYNAQGDAEGTEVWQFTTLADPSVKDFPYFEGFEQSAGKTFPAGWVIKKDGIIGWNISNYNAFDGKYSAYASGNESGKTATLTTPEFQLPDAPMQVSFYWGNRVPAGLSKDVLGTAKNTTTAPNDIDAGYFEIECDGTWTTLALLSDANNETWLRERFSLDAYRGKTVSLRWRYVIANGMRSTGISLDNVLIETTDGKCMAYFNANDWNAGKVNYQQTWNSKNTLSLINGGSAALTISRVAFSTDNFSTDLAVGTELKADAAVPFAITFHARTTAAAVEDRLTVEFSNGQQVSLPVQGVALAKDMLYYSFEGDEFASTQPNGFTTVDRDVCATIKPALINYPKIGTPFAFIVINVKPEPEGADWRNVYPVSGDQVLAAIADATHSSAVNDWIISQPMTATEQSAFRFFGKSYGGADQFHLHKVSVLVSTTTPDLDQFEAVKENITLPHSDEQQFTEFCVDLSAYAGKTIYVALQHVADADGFVAFFDDFTFEHVNHDPDGIETLRLQSLCISTPQPGCIRVDAHAEGLLRVYGIDGRLVREVVLKDGTTQISGLAAGIYWVANQKVVVR
ncbi:MAG: choice-of-anchor J domain-containing protein [Bacteroidaceae bacterium]